MSTATMSPTVDEPSTLGATVDGSPTDELCSMTPEQKRRLVAANNRLLRAKEKYDEASSDLTVVIYDMVQEGVSRYAISKIVGTSDQAINARYTRYVKQLKASGEE